MASAFSHAVVALALGKAPQLSFLTWPVVLLGAVCSMIPDLDVLGFAFGFQYGNLWGHRGMTHSIPFAALFNIALVELCFRQKSTPIRAKIAFYLFLCMVSHGVLDAMTNGGLGVAFFSPFDTERYFFGWRPVLVSPIGVSEFFNGYGLRVLASEAQWIWLPTSVTWLIIQAIQRAVGRKPAEDSSATD